MLTTRGARVRVLQVKAPKGAVVALTCRGRGCPARAMRRVVGARGLRLGRFERELRAGVVLRLRVRIDGAVKATTITIRRGKAPARTDACVPRGATREVQC